MPTARTCLRNSRWYYLFVFYSLISYTEAFYIMEITTKPNFFATYGLTKKYYKKDYKAELLKELAEDEDIYLATSTIHILNRLKTMRYKYITDSDVDDNFATKSFLMDTTSNSKIQNKSISFKNKTKKTFDSLWNMMRTLSDDSWNNDQSKDRKTSTPYSKQHSLLKNIDSSSSELYENYYDYQFTEYNKKRNYLTKATTTQSKFEGSKRKKKTKPSNHKRRKGYKSNSTDKTSNLVNISVRRLNTQACRCKPKKSQTAVKENTPLCTASIWKKKRKVKLMKQLGKNQEQSYKVNNTILLNVNNNGGCGCRKKSKFLTKHTTKHVTSEMPTAVTIPTTTKTTQYTTTTQLTTKTTQPTTQSTTQSTTQTTQSSTQTTQFTTKSTTNSPKITTTIKNITTESDECPDVFTCNDEMKIEVPSCLCSKNLMKQLSKVRANKLLFKNKRTTKLKKCNKTGFVSSTECAFETKRSLNDQSSTKICEHGTLFKDGYNKSHRILKRRRKHTTIESVRTSYLPPSTIKHLSISNWHFKKKKHSSFSTSTERNCKAKCIRMKCTTFKAMNDTTTCFQVRPSLTEDSEIYDDDMKETEYYEEYYDAYDEQTTTISTSTDERNDDGNQDVQPLPHYDIDGSTVFPEDDPALSAYNILHLFPFNFGRSSTVDSEYEEDINNNYISDLNPNSLESLAKQIYNTALQLKNDLDKTRSARIYMEKKGKLVRNSMESLNKIQKRCNYLLREINLSRRGYIRKLQQLLGLSKVRDQVEKKIKGKLKQILDDLKRRDSE